MKSSKLSIGALSLVSLLGCTQEKTIIEPNLPSANHYHVEINYETAKNDNIVSSYIIIGNDPADAIAYPQSGVLLAQDNNGDGIFEKITLLDVDAGSPLEELACQSTLKTIYQEVIKNQQPKHN